MTEDAYPNCRFYVEINGKKEALFTEVSGLQIEMQVEEYEEGGNNGYVHRFPGRSKVSNLTLKRGIVRSNDFFSWYMRVASGDIVRQNVSVVMYDVKGTELLRWNFVKAYPVKWVGPQFASDGATMSVESLELAHDGLSQV